MRVFCEVIGLLELEHTNSWDAARKLLYNNWTSKKDSLEALCRVMSECWFVLTEWFFFNQEIDEVYFRFKNTLVEVTQYGLIHFNSTPKFLWLAGYMIQMFPNYFYFNEDAGIFSKWEQLGKELLSLAVQLDPSNLIAQTLYRGTQSISAEYLNFKNMLNMYLDDLFPGQTAVEKYFREILS